MKLLAYSVLVMLWGCSRAQEITCPNPTIENGIIRNPKNVFKKDERLDFECKTGYKSEGRTPECTDSGWNPDPACKVILCLNQIVAHGEISPNKDSYTEGEIVDLNCQIGFEAKFVQNARPKCTASGWVPPLLCESKACDYIKIENGRLNYWSYERYPSYYFPMSNGRTVDYTCKDGFSSESGSAYGRMTCTSSGWSPAPKCLRTCPQDSFTSMNINYEQSLYTVGTTVVYKCDEGFTNPEGNDSGTMDCLPDGHFSEPKCTRSCIMPSGSFKNYKPNKKVFYAYERLQYECQNGFKSQSNNLVEKAECGWRGWTETPQCKEITCSLSQAEHSRYILSSRSRNFKDGDVVKFVCKEGYKVNGAKKAQCYYFGWYPEPPYCEEDFDPDLENSDGGDTALGSDEECSDAPVLANAKKETVRHIYYNDDTVTYTCDTFYILHGSNTITCQNGRWTSPPQCIERQPCSRPPLIGQNGEIFKHGSTTQFYSGDKVTYVCNAGYRLSGSNESWCIGGKWPAAPTCSGGKQAQKDHSQREYPPTGTPTGTRRSDPCQRPHQEVDFRAVRWA